MRPLGRIEQAVSRRDIAELSLAAFGFLLYFLVRGATVDRPRLAYEHALDLIALERALGIFVVDDLNQWTQQHLFWAEVMSLVYFWLHFPIIIGFGIWLYFRRRGRYTVVRDAFLASGAIALVGYWTYPVAPPRLLPELASRYDLDAPPVVMSFIDTMQQHLQYGYQTQSLQPFVNPYAAMPSLHFGWDLLLGAAVIWTFWHSRGRWLALAVGITLPVAQLLSITMTANHFVIDAAAGALVVAAGAAVAIALQRRVYPWVAARWEDWRGRTEGQRDAGAPSVARSHRRRRS